MPAPELPELIGALAQDAIHIQSMWNREYELELGELGRLAANAPRLVDFLAQLAPARLTARRFELTLSVWLGVERTHELVIRAAPLNLEAAARYGLRTEALSRISVVVEQAPIPPASSQR